MTVERPQGPRWSWGRVLAPSFDGHGFEPRSRLGLFLGKEYLPLFSLSTQVYKWVPGFAGEVSQRQTGVLSWGWLATCLLAPRKPELSAGSMGLMARKNLLT